MNPLPNEHRSLNEDLERLRVYRKRNPAFKEAMADFVEAEFSEEDPMEGTPVRGDFIAGEFVEVGSAQKR